MILRKKTEKNAPKKNTPTLYPKVSLGLSQQKSDDFDARGTTVHARPIDRARKPSLFFVLTRERVRERVRERRFPPRVSLWNAPHSSASLLGVPPTPLVGFKFSIETPTTLPVARWRDERRANRRAATRANRQRCAGVRANG